MDSSCWLRVGVHSLSAVVVLDARWSVQRKLNRVSMITPFNFVVPVASMVLSAIFPGESIIYIKYGVARCWSARRSDGRMNVPDKHLSGFSG
ncbi:hypothetical protein GA0061070_10257 [Kosakonia oryziphila]|uniref:Uncharacterized protein n=1 Tax=Kosakonia oryziphila TaxID=1005667 RepID=A0A1C4EN16_9ENTR|nr:hypothetical protein GA0061070_10257 [Kosakonia oryziphila]